MSYDDPFKDIRDLNRDFERLRELTRNPVDDINRIFREQQALLRGPFDDLSEKLKQAEAYRPLSIEAAGLLEPPEDLAAHLSAEVSRAGLELGRAWAQQEEFSRAGLPPTASSLLGDLDLTEIAHKALACSGVSVEQPLLALQDTLQDEVLKASNLIASIPALILEGQIDTLRHKLEVPEIANALKGFRETAFRIPFEHMWSVDAIGQLGEVANLLDLSYLGSAALQWSTVLQEPLADALGSLPLMESTLSAITAVARGLPLEDFSSIVERWELLVEAERSRSGERRLPPGKARLFRDLLAILLALVSLVHQFSVAKETTERLDQLEESQASIAEALEEAEEGEDQEREARALELAAIRQALADLAEHQQDGSQSELHLRLVSDNLPLRASASLDSEVILLIPKGSAVEVVEEIEGWCRVRVMNFATGELIDGWVGAEFLQVWPSGERAR